MKKTLIGFLLILTGAVPALGKEIGSPGKSLPSRSSITIPLSLLGGDVTVSFEDATGLSTSSLGVSVQLVSPADPILGLRLPVNLSIPAGFPVLVRIEPSSTGGLAFTGVATVQVHTLGLPLLGDSLRLVAAPLGGAFEDITTGVERNSDLKWDTSYRVIGTKGGFSEFLVVVDLTSLNTAIGAKLNRLDQILAANSGAIPSGVYADLAADLAAARAHSLPGDETAAIQDLDAFLLTVEQHSGTDVPDEWSSARDRVNVAGLLRAAAMTLQFSLHQRQDP